MPRSPRPATTVIGAGRLARAFLPGLAAAGYPRLTVFARRPAEARRACRGIRGARAASALDDALTDAGLILLAVADRSIEEVGLHLAKLAGFDWKRRIVLHHAGALGIRPLKPLARAGASVGVLHPMQCLGGRRAAAALLAGSAARIEGDRAAQGAARKLARDLGLLPLRFPSDLDDSARAAYHAAGSLLANDLVALITLAVELLESTGLDRRASMRALAPLVRGTLAQAEEGGPAAALTGPVPRGDLETILRQLRRLRRQSGEDAEIHRLLSRRLARVAAEHGELDSAGLRRLLRGIGSSSKRGL